MQPLFDKLAATPLVQKIGALLGLVALLGAGYWYFFYADLEEEEAQVLERPLDALLGGALCEQLVGASDREAPRVLLAEREGVCDVRRRFLRRERLELSGRRRHEIVVQSRRKSP